VERPRADRCAAPHGRTSAPERAGRDPCPGGPTGSAWDGMPAGAPMPINLHAPTRLPPLNGTGRRGREGARAIQTIPERRPRPMCSATGSECDRSAGPWVEPRSTPLLVSLISRGERDGNGAVHTRGLTAPVQCPLSGCRRDERLAQRSRPHRRQTCSQIRLTMRHHHLQNRPRTSFPLMLLPTSTRHRKCRGLWDMSSRPSRRPHQVENSPPDCDI